MILIFNARNKNMTLEAKPAGAVTPAAAENVFFTNPMLAHVGRMMTRLIPFLIVMVL